MAERGVLVERVLPDNRAAYKSYLWHDTCEELGIKVRLVGVGGEQALPRAAARQHPSAAPSKAVWDAKAPRDGIREFQETQFLSVDWPDL